MTSEQLIAQLAKAIERGDRKRKLDRLDQKIKNALRAEKQKEELK